MNRLTGLLLLSLVGLTACGPADTLKETPTEILGVWTTESREYGGREFHLTGSQLTIVIDPVTRYIYDIEKIEVAERNGRPFYTFHHVNQEGIDDTFRVEYATYPTTFIRLENVENVYWTRVEDTNG